MNVLQKNDFKVNVVTLKFGKYSDLQKTEIKNDLTIYRIQIPFYERLLFGLYSGLFSWFKQEIFKESDIIHQLDTRDCFFLNRQQKPVVLSINDYVTASVPLNPFKFPWKTRGKIDLIIRWFYNNISKYFESKNIYQADKLIISNDYVAGIYEDCFKIPDSKLNVIPRGIYLKEFENGEVEKEIDVLFLGGNLHKKGIEELIKSSFPVIKKYPNIKYLIIGRETNNYIQYLKKMIHEKNYGNNYEFISTVSHDQLVRIFLKSRIFIHPSYQDSLPQAVLEAMAAKLPVITTNVGGLPSLIEHGVNGFLVNPYEVDSISELTIKLLSDEKLRYEIGSNAYGTIKKKYNSELVFKEYLKLYNSLI